MDLSERIAGLLAAYAPEAIERESLRIIDEEVPEPRRQQLAQEAEAAIELLPPPRHRPAAAPVTTTVPAHAEPALELASIDDDAHDDES